MKRPAKRITPGAVAARLAAVLAVLFSVYSDCF